MKEEQESKEGNVQIEEETDYMNEASAMQREEDSYKEGVTTVSCTTYRTFRTKSGMQ